MITSAAPAAPAAPEAGRATAGARGCPRAGCKANDNSANNRMTH